MPLLARLVPHGSGPLKLGNGERLVGSTDDGHYVVRLPDGADVALTDAAERGAATRHPRLDPYTCTHRAALVDGQCPDCLTQVDRILGRGPYHSPGWPTPADALRGRAEHEGGCPPLTTEDACEQISHRRFIELMSGVEPDPAMHLAGDFGTSTLELQRRAQEADEAQRDVERRGAHMDLTRAELTAAIANLTDRVRELEAKLAGQRRAIEALTSHDALLQRLIEQGDEQLHDRHLKLTARVDSLEARALNDKANTRLLELEAKVAAQSRTLEVLRARLAEIEHNVDENMRDTAIAVSRLEQGKVSFHVGNLDAFEERLRALESSAATREALAAANQRADRAEARLALLEHGHGNLATAVTHIERFLGQLRARNSRLGAGRSVYAPSVHSPANVGREHADG